MTQHTDIAVVGAGPCGLAVCKALSDLELDYVCFDAGADVGGLWNVEAGGGGYRSLTTNTSNPNMAYADLPFEPDDPPILTAAGMVRYFGRFADSFGLRERIEFNTEVQRAEPLGDNGWRLETTQGERTCDQLIIAAGQYSAPHQPHAALPGDFSGDVLHVYDYLDSTHPVDLHDKRVVVVGLGTSAAELAAELSDPELPKHASQVIVSARSGRWVIPKLIDGMSMDSRAPHVSEPLHWTMRALGPWLATRVMQRLMGSMLRKVQEAVGGTAGLGLPSPAIEPWEDRPTVSLDFVPALQQGRIDVRPGIARFEGRRVHFTDGSSTEADAILYATGYDLSFPFLDEAVLGCAPNALALYRHIVHPTQRNLFFIGYCRVMCALWPVAEQQARWLARHLAGEITLPSQPTLARRAVGLRTSLPVMCPVYAHTLRSD